MGFDFSVVLIYLTVSAVVVGFALLLARLVSPRIPNAAKASTYECGEVPIGRGWYNFNPRFYLIALIFIVFEVEIALTYPVAVVVRDWIDAGRGLLAVLEIGLFLGILAFGLAWVWGRGDLDWMRELTGILDDGPVVPCKPAATVVPRTFSATADPTCAPPAEDDGAKGNT